MKTMKIGKSVVIVMSEDEHKRKDSAIHGISCKLKCALLYLCRTIRDYKAVINEENNIVDNVDDRRWLEHNLNAAAENIINIDKEVDDIIGYAIVDDFYRSKLEGML